MKQWVWCMVMVAALAACGSSTELPEPAGCQADVDCKGERICVQARCVDPTNDESRASQRDAGNPSDPSEGENDDSTDDDTASSDDVTDDDSASNDDDTPDDDSADDDTASSDDVSDDVEIPGRDPGTIPIDIPSVPTLPPMSEPPVSGTGRLGDPCDGPADCEAGLTCYPSSVDHPVFEGGVPNGYCSLPCDTDPECTAWDPLAFCGSTSEIPGHCLVLCQSPSVPCRGLDMACLLVDAVNDVGVCWPMCGNDLDCGGRYCDLSSGTCQDAPPTGDPIGTACDPLGPETCSGYCQSEETGTGVCSGLCTIGTYGCGLETLMTNAAGEPMCLPPFEASWVGTPGYCIQRCNCGDDCSHPEMLCAKLDDGSGEILQEIGTVGICLHSSLFEPSGLETAIECTE